MNADLREWLLSCPSLSHASTLVVDAERHGLVDLGDSLAKAVSLHVRWVCLGGGRPQLVDYHERMARLQADRRIGCTIEVYSGTALLFGTIAKGVGISQTPKTAVLHVRSSIPETVIAALPGRLLNDVIELPFTASREYRVKRAIQEEYGVMLWFDVPTIPIADALSGI